MKRSNAPLCCAKSFGGEFRMKHRIRRDQGKQGWGWFRPLGEVGREKPRADFAVSVPEGEVYPLRGTTQSIVSMTPVRRLFILGFLGAFLAVTVLAQTSQNIPDVTAITLEDLMDLQVTSVSKRAQKLADAAAAIFVITQDDIRRSGASSIPEALRFVPGLEVARIDENKWAIGSPGLQWPFGHTFVVFVA